MRDSENTDHTVTLFLFLVILFGLWACCDRIKRLEDNQATKVTTESRHDTHSR